MASGISQASIVMGPTKLSEEGQNRKEKNLKNKQEVRNEGEKMTQSVEPSE